MFITSCIREEWDATTRLGRVLWVPLFSVLLILSMVILTPVLILIYLLTVMVDAPIVKISRWLKKAIYK